MMERCTLHLDMMVDLVKQCSQTWRIFSTCTTHSRGGPRHGNAQKLYKEDEGKDGGMLVILDVKDLFRSGIVM